MRLLFLASVLSCLAVGTNLQAEPGRVSRQEEDDNKALTALRSFHIRTYLMNPDSGVNDRRPVSFLDSAGRLVSRLEMQTVDAN